MVRRILVANEKGGVGKTTTAVNLAHGLAWLMKKKVLLIDLDTQAAATISLGYAPESASHDLLMKQAPFNELVFPARDNLDLIRSNEELALALAYLDAMEAKRGKVDAARDRLKETLDRIDGRYDFVIIDCGPGLNILTINALSYSQEVLIPISLDFLSEVGTEPFINAIASMRTLDVPVRLRYIVPTFYHVRHQGNERVLERLRVAYKDLVTAPIRRNTDIAEAPEFGKTIFEYAPKSAGAQDYAALSRRVSHG
jgi:chromosome partitioning protein